MTMHGGDWYGWIRRAGHWERLSGPTRGLLAAGRAFDAELRRRGLRLANRDMVLTGGEYPRDVCVPSPSVRKFATHSGTET